MAEKILIVDDEPNLIRLLGYALHDAGYEVVAAQTGVEALSKIAAEQPDLVVLDVMMPDMTGLEVCQRIRQEDNLSTLPIIMLSARTQTRDKVAGLEAGVDEYVTKPVEVEEMVARVKALLARTERLRGSVEDDQPGKIIGVIGAKGGVGTTTVTLNLAAALAQSGSSVVAAELRSYFGTFSVQLNWEPSATINSLLELEPEYITHRELGRHLLDSNFGVKLLFGPQKETAIPKMQIEQAQAIVAGMSEIAAYVVLDLPHYLTSSLETTLRTCDMVLLVLEPEPASIVSAEVMINQLNIWGVGTGSVGAVIVNRSASANQMSLSQLEEVLPCTLVGMIPPMAEACRMAQVNGVPVVLYQPDGIASQNIHGMSERLRAAGRIIPLER